MRFDCHLRYTRRTSAFCHSRHSCFVIAATMLAVIMAPLAAACQVQPAALTDRGALEPVLRYIDNAWATLTRTQTDCKTISDEHGERKAVLYLPAGMAPPSAVQELEHKCGVQIRHLPVAIHHLGEVDGKQVDPAGLLYLPNSYVVPGGFFNEMYGWDSYFIILGLVRDHRTELARGIIENFFFEIEHYGAILNANRAYFLTRSQPPFLTSMILAVHAQQIAEGKDDHQWLARAYDYASRDYQLWNHEPHIAGDTALARYFDVGEGPAPEINEIKDPYYLDVARELMKHPAVATAFLNDAATTTTPGEWPRFGIYVCPSGAAPERECPSLASLGFTRDYYKGDRSMRESGFDISFRFGPFGARTHHFAPVCLNSLLFKAESDLAEMARQLGKQDEAAQWQQRAAARKAAINKYLWNSQKNMFLDYDIESRTQSDYVYATMFYPLWVGLASQEQARAVEQNLRRLERPGGIATSDLNTGVQWDLPYGWAPLQLIAIEGLRRYGFVDDANRISMEWLSNVIQNFRRDGTIREKYNVVTRSSEANVTAGYKQNVVGFGWTNGVFLQLLSELPAESRARLTEQASGAAAH